MGEPHRAGLENATAAAACGPAAAPVHGPGELARAPVPAVLPMAPPNTPDHGFKCQGSKGPATATALHGYDDNLSAHAPMAHRPSLQPQPLHEDDEGGGLHEGGWTHEDRGEEILHKYDSHDEEGEMPEEGALQIGTARRPDSVNCRINRHLRMDLVSLADPPAPPGKHTTEASGGEESKVRSLEPQSEACHPATAATASHSHVSNQPGHDACEHATTTGAAADAMMDVSRPHCRQGGVDDTATPSNTTGRPGECMPPFLTATMLGDLPAAHHGTSLTNGLTADTASSPPAVQRALYDMYCAGLMGADVASLSR